MSRQSFPSIPKSWGFDPAPSVAVAAPMIADELYPLMQSGFAEPIPAVQEITGAKSARLTNGRELSDIDAIVYCTGYDFCVPFKCETFEPYPVIGDIPNLFRGIFPIHEDAAVRNSLAYVGHAAIPFSGFVQHEIATMAVSQTWLGRSPLPSLPEMKDWISNHRKWRAALMGKQKIKTTGFYTAFMPMEHVVWLDRTAGTGVFEHFGWFKRKAWAFWWRDRELYKKCLGGLLSPAIWKLFETGKRKAWSGAREQIFMDNGYFEEHARERKKLKKQD